jgi:hypothetical protein
MMLVMIVMDIPMGDIGLELLQKTPGKTPILNIEGSNGGPKAIRYQWSLLNCGQN